MICVLHHFPQLGSTQDDAELDTKCLTKFTMQVVEDVSDEFKPSGRQPTSDKDRYSSEFML